MSEPKGASYAASGVDVASEELAMAPLLAWVKRAAEHRREGAGRACVGGGYFAEVIELGAQTNLGLAVCCDGVGTKLLIAQAADRYDTIGIDLVAMNVNDLICVGAEPLAFLDYLAVERPDPELFDQIGRGLHEGARLARVSIPGGEVAQVGELIRGLRPGRAFEMAGFAVGTVALDRIVDGGRLRPGDAVVGIASDGIHSNGLSLARRVLLGEGGPGIDAVPPELDGRTVGEELLRPTAIYVEPVLALLAAGLDVRAMAHITGDGLLNLRRVAAEVGFVIDGPLPVPGVFELIARLGSVPPAEMYTTFNMGTGFCVSLPADQVQAALDLLGERGLTAQRIGSVVADAARTVRLPAVGLAGAGRRFETTTEER